MKLIKKANKVLKIEDTSLNKYMQLGFDEIAEDGKVITKSVNSSAEKIANLEKLVKSRDKKIASLEAELKKLGKTKTSNGKDKNGKDQAPDELTPNEAELQPDGEEGSKDEE